MCGICGGITQPNPGIIKALMIANEERGRMSTGIASRIGEKIIIQKDVIESHLYVEKIKDSLINDANLVIAHTRQPSSGVATQKNAHPFRYNSIVGAHNGHVSNHLEIKYAGDVDSLAIFHLLSIHKNNYVEVFKQLTGSMTVVWMVDGDPNLYMVRHINPLYIARVNNTLYFNSEERPLQIVLQAAGYTPKIESLTADMVYKVSPSLDMTLTPVEFKPAVYTTPATAYGYNEQAKLPATTVTENKFIYPNSDPWEESGRRWGYERAKLSYGTGPQPLWSLRQVVENMQLFKANGKINKKAMRKKAKTALIQILGNQGYDLVKNLNTSVDFGQTLIKSFGCQICHHVPHHCFWFNKASGMVYCTMCVNGNERLRNLCEEVDIK